MTTRTCHSKSSHAETCFGEIYHIFGAIMEKPFPLASPLFHSLLIVSSRTYQTQIPRNCAKVLCLSLPCSTFSYINSCISKHSSHTQSYMADHDVAFITYSSVHLNHCYTTNFKIFFACLSVSVHPAQLAVNSLSLSLCSLSNIEKELRSLPTSAGLPL